MSENDFAVCGICGNKMNPGVKCTDRSPLENRALDGGFLRPGDTCNDCNAPVEGPHHANCKFLWCPEHNAQALLCFRAHLN